MRAFAYGCGPDEPVGASLRDAEFSYARGIEGIEAAVDASPPLQLRVDTSGSRPMALKVKLSVVWDSPPDGVPPMTSVADALLTHATYARRFGVRFAVEVRRISDNAPVCETIAFRAHLELPAVVEGGTPPESGYFIVHGREYVIRNQERFAFGIWMVTTKKGSTSASMRIAPPWPGAACRSIRMYANVLLVRFREGRTLPLAAVLLLLGEPSAEAFAARVGEPRFDARPLAAAWPASRADAEEALRSAVRQPAGDTDALLAEWVLPHVEAGRKLDMLAHGSARLARGSSDDLDHLASKRLDAAGDMLACAVGAIWHKRWAGMPKQMTWGRQKWTGSAAECGAALQASAKDHALAMVAAVSEAVQHGFVTPDWVGTDGVRTSGVCEKIVRLNAPYQIGLMRCTRSTLGEGGSRKREPRLPHGSAYGMLCPVYAVDDENIGLIKAVAATARTSERASLAWVPPADGGADATWFLVVDGQRCGRISCPVAYAAAFSRERVRAVRAAVRSGDGRAVFVAAGVTCAQRTADREVWVRGDAGRLVRPLMVVGRQPPERLESLTQLLSHGCLEYIDAGSVDDATFWVATDAGALEAGIASATSEGHLPPSHLEMHPALFMSLPAASIPFAHHNQSTRNNFYASSQFKQAVGVPHPAWLTWRTMNAQALVYPQRPLVTTAAEGAMRAADLPSGVNALMMIGYLDGYNQEDALVANSRSMELGMFHSMQFDAYSKGGVCAPTEDEDGGAFDEVRPHLRGSSSPG